MPVPARPSCMSSDGGRSCECMVTVSDARNHNMSNISDADTVAVCVAMDQNLWNVLTLPGTPLRLAQASQQYRGGLVSLSS